MIILGISGGIGHDSAACIVRDGQLVAMAEEERFVRIKRAPNLPPVQAIKYCLNEANVSLSDVDYIALSWDPQLDPQTPQLVERMKAFGHHEIFRGQTLPPIIPVDHHTAHAAASFYPSGFDDALIIVADGQGEISSTTLGYGSQRGLTMEQSFGISQSLGYFYSSVAHYVGLGSNSAGKLMGLASYGQPRYDFDIVHLHENGYLMDIKDNPQVAYGYQYGMIRQQWLSYLSERFGLRQPIEFRWNHYNAQTKRHIILNQHSKDIAASTQTILEQILIHLVKLLQQKHSSRNLVLSGGVALNCTANGVLIRSGLIDNLYVFPAAHDAGGALGAALHLAMQKGEPRCIRIDHAYWGPSFDDETIAKIIANTGLEAKVVSDIGDHTAELLCSGAIVGWFQGAMEVGPRALGHRSILADPTNVNNHRYINQYIKDREPWRPFAPSVLASGVDQILETPGLSPFMLQAFQMKPNAAIQLPAITHVDGSTRPQTLTGATSPRYHALLVGMQRRIGFPTVLNTSFNGAHEPIVCTPYDAIRTFFSTKLDILVLGNHLITKPRSAYIH